MAELSSLAVFFRQGVELPPLRQRGASETPTTQRAGESDAEL